MNTVESPQPQLALQHHIACLPVIQRTANSQLMGRTGFQIETKKLYQFEKQTNKKPTGNTTKPVSQHLSSSSRGEEADLQCSES